VSDAAEDRVCTASKQAKLIDEFHEGADDPTRIRATEFVPVNHRQAINQADGDRDPRSFDPRSSTAMNVSGMACDQLVVDKTGVEKTSRQWWRSRPNDMPLELPTDVGFNRFWRWRMRDSRDRPGLISWWRDLSGNGINERWQYIEYLQRVGSAVAALADDLVLGFADTIPQWGVALIEDVLSGMTTEGIAPGFGSPPTLLYATWWAQHGWAVFPQSPNKVPRIPNPHPKGSVERVQCKGACGHDGHGDLDATTDFEHLRSWHQRLGGSWGGIAARLPQGLIDLDIDPRHGGDLHLATLEADYGPLPSTLEIISGRCDGGKHLIYQVPPGLVLDGHRLLGTGVDLKDHRGAVRLPPSTHHVTFMPYRLVPRAIASAPAWLLTLLLADPKNPVKHVAKQSDSLADWFAETATWNDLLTEHGWVCTSGDGDSDGSRWRRPGANEDRSSASIIYGRLFVFSTSTEFEPTAWGDPHGYTKFRAYTALEHNGDMRVAATALRAEKEAGLW